MGFNLSKALHSLVGFTPVAGQQAGKAVKKARTGTVDNRITNSMVNRGLLPKRQMENVPQMGVWEDNSGVNMGMQQRPQGMPLNGNVGRQSWNQPQQGFGQQVQGVGSMPQQLQAPQTYWQNTDQRLRNMLNPQVEDDGYYY